MGGPPDDRGEAPDRRLLPIVVFSIPALLVAALLAWWLRQNTPELGPGVDGLVEAARAELADGGVPDAGGD